MEDETGEPETGREAMDKAWAMEAIEWPLRELTSNVMRISRGAGKPYEILKNCCQVVQRFQEYRETVGFWPSTSELQQILSFRDPRLKDYRLPYDEMANAVEDVVSGALRMAAGRLLFEKLQADHGNKELIEGVNRIEQHRKELRAK